MAQSFEKESTYCCFDLDKVIDFSQKTLIEKSNMVDEIFSKQMRLGSKIGCQAFREFFLREVDKVHKTYKDQIVFCLKGKLTFRQLEEIILSFFKVWQKSLICILCKANLLIFIEN